MPKSNAVRDTSNALTAIDLFCGAGGFSLGLEKSGFAVLVGVDSWQLALDSYTKNFKHPVLCADLAAVSGVEIGSAHV